MLDQLVLVEDELKPGPGPTAFCCAFSYILYSDLSLKIIFHSDVTCPHHHLIMYIFFCTAIPFKLGCQVLGPIYQAR